MEARAQRMGRHIFYLTLSPLSNFAIQTIGISCLAVSIKFKKRREWSIFVDTPCILLLLNRTRFELKCKLYNKHKKDVGNTTFSFQLLVLF